jgi:glycosyltransferase involved in cell wall biosynthesis
MNKPLISVIVPTFNRSAMLGDALQTLVCQETGGEFSYEVIVVDNASTDATKEVIERVAAEAPVPVRYVYHDVHGDAPPRNRAIAESQGQWLAFFDDDQLAATDWLWQLYHAARETGAPVVGGAVHLHLPQDVLDKLGPYVRRTSFRETEPTPQLCRFTGKRLPGCANVLVARHLFDTIGLFDTKMYSGGSDSDFFYRVRTAGNPMFFSPHAIIRHRIPLNRLTPEYFRWDAHQGCDALASHDCRYRGRVVVVLRSMIRIAHGLLVLVPGLLWAYLRGNRGEVLDYKVRLWRVSGYFRRTLALVAPRLFAQENYFSYLNFRKGRTIGQTNTTLEMVS